MILFPGDLSGGLLRESGAFVDENSSGMLTHASNASTVVLKRYALRNILLGVAHDDRRGCTCSYALQLDSHRWSHAA